MKRFGADGLPPDTVHLKLTGHAGQSLGAWLCRGVMVRGRARVGAQGEGGGRGCFDAAAPWCVAAHELARKGKGEKGLLVKLAGCGGLRLRCACSEAAAPWCVAVHKLARRGKGEKGLL
eukprot:351529-Chlamydomonas_euryale.AAC.3